MVLIYSPEKSNEEQFHKKYDLICIFIHQWQEKNPKKCDTLPKSNMSPKKGLFQ